MQMEWPVVRRKPQRFGVIEFFAGLETAPSRDGPAHVIRAPDLVALGHEVRLVPPAYGKPVVKRQKNDAADAEASCRAADRNDAT